MAMIPLSPRIPNYSTNDPPRMVFPPREVNNMAHTINRPPRPYEGIGVKRPFHILNTKNDDVIEIK